MSDIDGLGDLFECLDAWPSACRRVWRWPMNESHIFLEVSASSDRVKAVLPDDAFPDGAVLCDVFGLGSGACSGGCGACEISVAANETSDQFILRVRRFCERVCERMVSYEDRFLREFRT